VPSITYRIHGFLLGCFVASWLRLLARFLKHRQQIGKNSDEFEFLIGFHTNLVLNMREAML
jgi:hypothetical protein